MDGFEHSDAAWSHASRGGSWSDTLTALSDPSLDPIFWRADRLGSPSAWWHHVPFAHWVICATAPRIFVELGTHTGVSYAAFCQAVVRAKLSTRCHAVDTWRGDPQAGPHGSEVLHELRTFHDERFGAFSTLLQCTFDEALDHIEDGSIDLLHIDGLHTYEAVQHDFEGWLPKLSDRAVVLFHDINVRSGDFGVWRLWADLRQQYRGFEFVHGYGLGVLAVGEDTPAPVAALCELVDPAAVVMIRTRFAWLGDRWSLDTRERLLAQDVGRRVAAANAEAEQLLAEVARRTSEVEAEREAAERTAEQLRTASARISRTEQELAELRERAEQAEARVKLMDAKSNAAAARAAQALARAQAERDRFRHERDHVLGSIFWRITGPLRRIASILPPSLRRQGRRIARVAYWVLTPHRTRERIAYFRARREARRADRGSEHGIGMIWGLPADAEMHCLKSPSFDKEVALFVTYSPNGELKPHVLHYVQSLRREMISVVLIINAEHPLEVSGAGLLPHVDGLFVRQNKGYDFAAWAHVLQMHRELFEARIVYLINDSLIGPIDQSEFSDLINKIRANEADVIGLTENLEICWHLQSYFLAFRERALHSAAFDEFMKSIVCFEDKRDVIREYELRLANILKAAGLDCEPLFRARGPTICAIGHWKELLESGFPFVKTQVISNPSAERDPGDCLELLSARGFDVRLAEWAAPVTPVPDEEPDRPRDHVPADQLGRKGRPGEVSIRTVGTLEKSHRSAAGPDEKLFLLAERCPSGRRRSPRQA